MAGHLESLKGRPESTTELHIIMNSGWELRNLKVFDLGIEGFECFGLGKLPVLGDDWDREGGEGGLDDWLKGMMSPGVMIVRVGDGGGRNYERLDLEVGWGWLWGLV